MKKISVLLCFHREGAQIVPTLKSLHRAAEIARSDSVEVEFLLVGDRCDPYTFERVEFFSQKCGSSRLLQVDFGCPALSRNYGIAHIDSNYIAIQDADDLVCDSWLSRSLQVFDRDPDRHMVLHPEWNLTFESEQVLMRHPCMKRDANLFLGNLFNENYWTALCIAPTEVFRDTPYVSNRDSGVFGYEDWSWNLDVLSKGIPHVSVPSTVHFIRRKRSGVSHQERTSHRIVRPSPFFLDRRFHAPVATSLETNVTVDESAFHEASYLSMNPDIQEGVNQGFFASGYMHYRDYGSREGRVGLTVGLVDDLKTQGEFDYALRPDSEFLRGIRIFEPVKFNDRANACQSILRKFSTLLISRTILGRVDTIVAAPWVEKGGADLALLFHLQYLHRQGKKVLLVLTETSRNAWIERVPESVMILNMGGYGLDRQTRRDLLFNIVSLCRTKAFHVINSEAGWDVLIRYGEQFRDRLRIFVSLYCYDYTQQGSPVGYARNVAQAAANIDFVFTDNLLFKEHLVSHYDVPANLIGVLCHPVLDAKSLESPAFYNAGSSNILWASRLDRQKRPDILYQVAKLLPEFTFHVYGSHLLDDPTHVDALRGLPNVHLQGAYNGFRSIVESGTRFSAFLYTSQWDGLPNILLEVATAGLPIVSSSVGGIRDFLKQGRGFLVDPVEDVAGYVHHLKSLRENPSAGSVAARSLSLFTREVHCESAFDRALEQSGY